MTWQDDGQRITNVAELEAVYGEASPGSLMKEVGYLHPHYRAFIEAAPFMVLASCGAGGLDASPRGDAPGFVSIEDDNTLLIPDRRGNNRTDTLRNILEDPRVGLLFLIPGVGETLRVNGRAEIATSPSLLERFVMEGKAPRSVLIVHVETVYFQCSKAIVRSELWNPDRRVERSTLPSSGRILADLSQSRVGGDAYDRELPARIKATLW
jgi:PPOX class probable FMN-dependent enzyme